MGCRLFFGSSSSDRINRLYTRTMIDPCSIISSPIAFRTKLVHVVHFRSQLDENTYVRYTKIANLDDDDDDDHHDDDDDEENEDDDDEDDDDWIARKRRKRERELPSLSL
ncbi:hypothetical protein HZH68_010956 [Vespula germanica]|uniref:Uncharacterized protein n=1 Tax=Vespula germanica TaxID=30212 RepID=A0A834JV13_VESGE|nr:hypothetical protein HZH68_010956 [Vespula germanica]